MEYKKKKNFFFGKAPRPIGRIYMRKAYNNMFFTLTDLNSKVVCSKSSKSIIGRGNKRRRTAPHTIEPIIGSMSPHFSLYNLQGVQIYFKTRYSSHYRYLINALQAHNLKIKQLKVCRPLAFHKGIRGRRLRKK
jgi:ribosomal protein S11